MMDVFVDDHFKEDGCESQDGDNGFGGRGP